MSILKFFLPKDKVFYTLFESASANLESLAAKLVEVVNESDYNKRATIVKQMEDLEHENDKLTHNIFVELGKNFITPFDREDIHSLASALDDIADYIYATAKKLNFYKVDPTSDQGIIKMADAIKESVLSVNRAVLELRNLKNINKVVECVIKINGIENNFWSNESLEKFLNLHKNNRILLETILNTYDNKNQIKLIHGFSNDTKILELFEKDSIDILYIDGDHSFNGCYSDLKNWYPKVKKNGFIINDDFSWSDVNKAINTFCSEIGVKNLIIDGNQSYFQKLY
jgi:predicted phosphate transport protein (TIGR00153 family)